MLCCAGYTIYYAFVVSDCNSVSLSVSAVRNDVWRKGCSKEPIVQMHSDLLRFFPDWFYLPGFTFHNLVFSHVMQSSGHCFLLLNSSLYYDYTGHAATDLLNGE